MWVKESSRRQDEKEGLETEKAIRFKLCFHYCFGADLLHSVLGG